MTTQNEPTSSPQDGPEPPEPQKTPWEYLREQLTLKHIVLAILAAALLFCVNYFEEKEHREDVSHSLEVHVKEPVARVAPLELAGHFALEMQDCDTTTYPRRCSNDLAIWMIHVPQALASTAAYTVRQGVAATVLAAIAVALCLAGLVSFIRDEDFNVLQVLNPVTWFLLALAFCIIVWAMQGLILGAIFFVDQTLAAAGLLIGGYLVYEKFELWHKITHALHLATGEH